MTTSTSTALISRTVPLDYGTRPVGSCKPDGSHIWATRFYFADTGAVHFITYDGWLVQDETRTNDPNVVALLHQHFTERIGS